MDLRTYVKRRKSIIFTLMLLPIMVLLYTVRPKVSSPDFEADFLSLHIRQPPVLRYRGNSEWDTDRSYGIVVDAGSSGSRLYVYSWLKNMKDGLQKGDPKGEKFDMKELPGISSFENNAVGVKKHLDPLLKFAAGIVPFHKLSSTPIYLFATAGMRLVPEISRDEILDTACKHVKDNYAFFIADCSTNFRVISGDLEGIFGFLTVNYLKTGFQEKSKSYGFIDMGGASAQIAFEPTKSMAIKHKDDLRQVILRGKDGMNRVHNVFVTSFLGFGANQARERYLELYSKNGEQFVDPCLPIGLEYTTKDKTIVGGGSFHKCGLAITPLLRKDLKCKDSPCFFNGVHVPLEDFTKHLFLGVSELWYTTSQGFDLGGPYSFKKFQQAATNFCNTTWTGIEKGFEDNQYRNIDSIDRLKVQCFKSAYLSNLLHEGFGLPQESEDNNGPMLESIDELNGYSVSWTMGAMLLYSSSTIKEKSLVQLETISLPFVSIFGVLMLIAFGLFVQASRRKGLKVDMAMFHAIPSDLI